MIFRRVLLPPPLGPIMVKKSLILMERFISLKQAAHGYVTDTSSISTAFSIIFST
jgi:hypothetical protein